ncbi:glycosyl transferase family group 2-domain-containing protein [Lactifluus subvellereus]|nr:glycosyl transferase family group 2-domain-containing protein [Lactifluus subvellereus]
MAVEEIYQESGQRFKPWAHNAKALRMGEVILIVDSDTIVLEVRLACFSLARLFVSADHLITGLLPRRGSRACGVPRALRCPRGGPGHVAHHYFENGVAHFTRRINKCISMACANGEVAPFVGHNAFLWWSALQDAAFEDSGDDNKIWTSTWLCVFRSVSPDRAKYWLSDHHVQLKGYIIRWSTYSEGGFKEGVSLTYDDELNRWQKYSHGSFFLGGLSVHLSQTLLAHLFSYITWGATKEVERSNFFIEVPRILRRFWLALVISFFLFAMIAVLAINLVPPGWQIPGVDWAVIFPLAVVAGSHILSPTIFTRLDKSVIHYMPRTIFFFFLQNGLKL